MIKFSTLLFTASFATFVFVSCSSEDEPQPEQELTKTEMLAGTSSKSWQIQERPIKDEACAELTARELDNRFEFHADLGFNFDHGEITEDACGTGDLALLEGAWRFNAAEDSLFINIHKATNNDGEVVFEEPFQLFAFKIESISAEELKVASTVDGETLNMTFVFK